jgi:hypothetical protein
MGFVAHMPDPTPCTAARRCSSTGIVCEADDRACQSDATSRGLEITCERAEPHGYLYCPPGASARDATAVWILLAVAVAIAIFGGAAAYVVFRKGRA